MEITEVRIYPANEGVVRGYARIILDDSWVVRNLRIIRNDSGGLYVAMPSKKQLDGSFREMAYPITAEARVVIEEAVLTAYRQSAASKTHQEERMIDYKGYLILGTALMIHPNSLDWRAVGIVCRKTPEGLIVQIERTGDPVFTTKGAAEQQGLALCREWVDEQIRSNQMQEENQPHLLH